MESLDARIRRVTRERVAVVPYDRQWPLRFLEEKRHLQASLPADLVGRIEHFGSTAVPGLSAKPIVDVLVEVTDLDAARCRIVPVLEAQGYEYFWRPTHGEDGPPFYAWFIKRDATGTRTHHIHMVEPTFTEHWDRLLFRDYLIAHPEAAREYEALKCRLAEVFADDRVAYTRAKGEFIAGVMAQLGRRPPDTEGRTLDSGRRDAGRGGQRMDLGAFSISLAVKDLEASRAFYEKFGFRVFAGEPSGHYLMMKNGSHVIGLFRGLFDKNILTFNPGWDADGRPLPAYTDVRELQRQLKAQGVHLEHEADERTTGPASFIAVDPDGNPILVDQHV